MLILGQNGEKKRRPTSEICREVQEGRRRVWIDPEQTLSVSKHVLSDLGDF